MQLGRLSLLASSAISLIGCSEAPVYTEQQQACIAQLYASYDAGKLEQCVNVCKSCMRGTTTTCNTSCKLKGAR